MHAAPGRQPDARAYTWCNRRACHLDAARVDFIILASRALDDRVVDCGIDEPPERAPAATTPPVWTELRLSNDASRDGTSGGAFVPSGPTPTTRFRP